MLLILATNIAGTCVPSDNPSVSPDGKFLAILTGDGPRTQAWLYDLQQQRVIVPAFPEPWRPLGISWVGDDLIAYAGRDAERVLDPRTGEPARFPSSGDPVYEQVVTLLRYDRESATFQQATSQSWKSPARYGNCMGITNYQGKLAIAVAMGSESDKQGKRRHTSDIYSPETFERLATLEQQTDSTSAESVPAGRGWTMRVSQRLNSLGNPDIALAEVVNPKGEKSLTINPDKVPALQGSPLQHLSPVFVRVSKDEKVLLWVSPSKASQHKHIFLVFNLESGELLWKGICQSMVGIPIVGRKEAWAIDFDDPHLDTSTNPIRDRFALARYQANAFDPVEEMATSEHVFVYELGEGNSVTDYTPTPDESQLMVVVSGKRPRLLFVPVDKEATADDVKVVELKAD